MMTDVAALVAILNYKSKITPLHISSRLNISFFMKNIDDQYITIAIHVDVSVVKICYGRTKTNGRHYPRREWRPSDPQCKMLTTMMTDIASLVAFSELSKQYIVDAMV